VLARGRVRRYTGSVKKLLFLSALALSCACAAGGPTLFSLDDDDPRAIKRDNELEERRAKEALAEIEKKVELGALPKIQFEFDKDAITPESGPTLNLVAELLLKHPRLKLIALAHTDNIGTEEYNLDLSERRARSVKTYLVQQGVPPPSIRFKGMGYSMPLEDNSTDEGRAKNRRVEFRVTYREWNAVY
jgi:outer membrane protein OmpA-like peptidoglycan-associated protein